MEHKTIIDSIRSYNYNRLGICSDDFDFKGRVLTISKMIYIMTESFRSILNPTEKDYKEYIEMIILLFDREREYLIKAYELEHKIDNYFDAEELDSYITSAFHLLEFFIMKYLDIMRYSRTIETDLTELVDDISYNIEDIALDLNGMPVQVYPGYITSDEPVLAFVPKPLAISSAIIYNVLDIVYQLRKEEFEPTGAFTDRLDTLKMIYNAILRDEYLI